MMVALNRKLATFESGLVDIIKEANNPLFIGELLLKKAYFLLSTKAGMNDDEICQIAASVFDTCSEIKSDLGIEANQKES